MTDVFTIRSDEDVASALEVVFNGDLSPRALGLHGVFVRRHDDTDGRRGPEQEVAVHLDGGEDVILNLPDSQPLRFRPESAGGRSRRTRNALLVLAEAIRRENMEAPQADLSQATPARIDYVKPEQGTEGERVVRAFDTLIDGIYWIHSLNVRDVYMRQHDDAPQEYCPLPELQGTFGPDGDAWLMLPGFHSLRFRQYSGGGKSMRTLSGLKVLFEAIRRDNENGQANAS